MVRVRVSVKVRLELQLGWVEVITSSLPHLNRYPNSTHNSHRLKDPRIIRPSDYRTLGFTTYNHLTFISTMRENGNVSKMMIHERPMSI